MWNYPFIFDVIVVGAGHAGCEAAFSAAHMGASVLLLTMNPDTIAKMSCNPAIGGTAKGHIVREIDALGGIMGKIADETAIHFRMLNQSKGPAVRSPRAQSDKLAYHKTMKHTLEKTTNLEIKQGTAIALKAEKEKIIGIDTLEGIAFLGKTVVLSSGTFMRGLLHIGQDSFSGGRNGDKACKGLSPSLKTLGFSLGRLKTGTPPRINKRSIDFSRLEKQESEQGVCFSFDSPQERLPQIPCYITYTTEETKAIILRDLQKSALFSGKIQGRGPRYCPSIEDKITRFAHKERHQLFLEPEGVDTEEFYVNGFSTSLPIDTQLEALHTIVGLEKAEILRPAYAIEYDWVTSGQIYSSLETKKIEGLFFAGQINGTTGYEEAAAQGLVAGINAACKALGKKPFIPERSESYIGVLIDDLISKEIDEPYRMFTSRAEHRLLLRQDNADLRLRKYGYELGLIDSNTFEKLQKKQALIEEETKRLSAIFLSHQNRSISFAHLLARPEYSYEDLLRDFPEKIKALEKDIQEQIECEIKYAGYIQRQAKEIAKWKDLDKILIPKNFAFKELIGLRNEAKEKFMHFSPENLGTASRIGGISPADISLLMIALERRSRPIETI